MAESHIDPNQAQVEELRQLPGIGAGLARRIADGGPYRSPDDLLSVPGLGQHTLERIRPQLRFDQPQEGEAAAGDPAALKDRPPVADKGAAPSKDQPSAAGRRAGRGIGWWAALSVVAAAVLCSVTVSLGVLLGINGTLNYGRHAAVLRVESRLRSIESDLGQSDSELGALRQRLEVIEGVSGRMTELEARLDQVQGRLDQLADQLDGMQAQLTGVQQQADRIERLEGFLDGLQRLLDELFAGVEG